MVLTSGWAFWRRRSCGTDTSLLTRATLRFFVQSDPQSTTGLTADVDTTTLAGGEHVITATTAAGTTVKNTVTVNNAPAGASRLMPVDGTLVAGTKPVFAMVPAAGEGGDNTIKVVAGDLKESCGNNRDDFAISNIALTPAQGTATGQMLKASYGMGDGNCGDNVNPLTEIDLSWELLLSLLSFNVGMEMTQLAIIAVLFPLLVLLRRTSASRWAMAALSVPIAAVSLYWFFDRIPLPL